MATENKRTRIKALITAIVAALSFIFFVSLLVPTAYAEAEDEYMIICSPDGDGSELLIDVYIDMANSNAGLDTIVISPTEKACTFNLVNAVDDYGTGAVGLPLITDDLIIRALGPGAVLQRDASTTAIFRILESDAHLTLENVTIRNGRTLSSRRGGGIYAHHPLTLTNVVITANRSYGGGGLYATADLLVDGVTVSNNETSTDSPSHGGGIWLEGALTARAISITGNTAYDCGCGGDDAYGGGIYVNGSAHIDGALFAENESTRNYGGGLYVAGDLTLSDSAFYSNTARYSGGGAFVNGSLTLSNSIFGYNQADYGAGVAIDAGTANTISGTTFERNVAAQEGGGLLSYESVLIDNSRFLANEALGGGGAHLDSGTVQNSVFAANSANGTEGIIPGGGGLLVIYDVNLQNNLFLNNTATRGGGASILLAPPFSSLSLILNNLWVDNDAGDAASLYLGVNVPDLEPGQAEVSHNTVVRQTLSSESAIVVGKGGANVRNNIITHHTIGVSAGVEASVTSDYNLYYQNVIHQAGVSGGANNLDGDPLFVDPAAGDYHLQVGSPAIDSALALGVGVDKDGVVRPQGDGYDRGAYEHVIANAPPVAIADVYTTTVGVPLNIAAPGVLENDSDPDGNDLTALVESVPGSGTLDLQPDGAFTYSPNSDFVGSDTFTYRAVDGLLQSEPAIVTVHVVAQEPSPGHSLYLPLLLAP